MVITSIPKAIAPANKKTALFLPGNIAKSNPHGHQHHQSPLLSIAFRGEVLITIEVG